MENACRLTCEIACCYGLHHQGYGYISGGALPADVVNEVANLFKAVDQKSQAQSKYLL